MPTDASTNLGQLHLILLSSATNYAARVLLNDLTRCILIALDNPGYIISLIYAIKLTLQVWAKATRRIMVIVVVP